MTIRRPWFTLLPCVWLLLAAAVAVPPPARAVILYRTDDPEANTAAPTGVLADSGWQFQGQFGRFLGTPIAPDLFLTAKHFGGEAGLGTPFVLDGVSYPTVAVYDDPASDLRLVRVQGTFPTYAPLFDRRSDPVGKPLVVFGRGTQRGAAVNVSAAAEKNAKVAGWTWGAANYRLRYGTNVVAGVTDGGPGMGRLLYATFDADGGLDEAQLSDGDSGGAVFLHDQDGAWKLAGINYGVSGPYSYAADGSGAFNAAVFRGDGLFENAEPTSGPGAFFATEVAARMKFIRLVLGQTALARIGDDVLFGFASENGQSYRVERRTDDPNADGTWETLADHVAGNGGTVLVTDPGAAGQPRRSYRAVMLP